MLSLIATLVLASGAPLDWQFPGPDGPALQAALLRVTGPAPPGHLIDETAREAHLAEVRWTGELGCLADAEACPDAQRAVYAALSISGQVVARSEGTADGQRVILTLLSVDAPEPQTYTGEGSTLDEAAREAFAGLRGRVTVVLTLDPPDAAVLLDGKPLGQGSGTYMVPPGDHDLTFEAPGRRTIKQPIRGNAGERLTIEMTLPPAVGRLSLKVEPPTAEVFLDGARWEDFGTHRELSPGPHTLRAVAEGYETFTQEVVIKTATVHDLSLKLRPSEPTWREALSRPHADTGARPWTVRVDLRGTSARDGEVALELPNGGTLREQAQSMGLIGVGFSAGWRSEHLLVEALGLSYESGSTKTDARFENESIGDIDALSRLSLRPLWVGGRYPMWRFEPYALVGMTFAWETFDVDRPSGAQQVSDTRFLLGAELGLRYAIDDAMSAGVGAVFDVWPGERAAAAVMAQFSYAIDLPEPWK